MEQPTDGSEPVHVIFVMAEWINIGPAIRQKLVWDGSLDLDPRGV